MGIYVFIFLLISPLNGGMQWGARFMLPFYPLMSILAMYVLSKFLSTENLLQKRLFISIFILALAISFINELRGIELLYYKKFGSRKLIN